MDLDLSPEQEMLREMVRGVCSSYAPLETVRALEDDPVRLPRRPVEADGGARPHRPDGSRASTGAPR